MISSRGARAVLACFMALALIAGCGSETRVTQPVLELPSGLKIEDVTQGSGPLAVTGRIVTVHYVLFLADGTRIDSSFDRGQPFEFTLGSGNVIKGMDLGIHAMRIGGRRILTMSPDLGYGSRGYPPVVPPNSTLVMDVTLLGVRVPTASLSERLPAEGVPTVR